jgi:hypothetical protein
MEQSICGIKIVAVVVAIGLNAPTITPAAINRCNPGLGTALDCLAARHMQAVHQIIGLSGHLIIIDKGNQRRQAYAQKHGQY